MTNDDQTPRVGGDNFQVSIGDNARDVAIGKNVRVESGAPRSSEQDQARRSRPAPTTSDEQAQLHQLIEVKQRRLRVLELQQAYFGPKADAQIIIEIEDLSQDIAELQQRLDQAAE